MKGSSMRLFVRVFWVGLVMGAISAGLYADHSWGSYHWARSTTDPFTLKLGDNVSSTWDDYLDEASADWNLSGVLVTQKVAGGTDPRKCRPKQGLVQVCNAKYGFNGWLGLAQIWVSGSHITQAITKMNDSYFNIAPYNSPPWRRLVMCQEVGHTFGLDHQDENFNNENLGTCMDYTSDPDGPLSNEHPNYHDYEQLGLIYGHPDSSTVSQTTSQKMPPAMTDIDFSGPGQWGKLIRGSQEQGFSVYELDFGGGRKIITHVYWVRRDHQPQE